MNAKSKVLHEWLKEQGVVICNDPEAAELFLTYTIPVASTFPEIVDKLSVVYTYRMNEQGTADLRSNDGVSWHYEPELGTLYGIGLSVEALNSGRDYAAFVFLHELCHIATSTDHSIILGLLTSAKSVSVQSVSVKTISVFCGYGDELG